MAHIISIDFETTGIDPKTCHPVEIGLCFDSWDFVSLIKSPEPLSPEVSAIHHIVDEDLEFGLTWEDVQRYLAQCLSHEPSVLVAHNAAYEAAILARCTIPLPPVQWICTYKAAVRLWPDAPNYKNETLRYLLKLDKLGRTGSQATHSAMHDARVTYLLLLECLKHATLEQLIQWTSEPAALSKMPMGKHIGMKWEDVPGPYLEWINKQADMREDVKHCATQELKRRRQR